MKVPDSVVMEGYRKGMGRKEIAKALGIGEKTVARKVQKNITPRDIEEFRKARAGKFEVLMEQQMEIQREPEVAYKIAQRFGPNVFESYGRAIDRAEGKDPNKDELIIIHGNIKDYMEAREEFRKERERLEEELKKLVGGLKEEETTGGPNAVIEGKSAEDSK